MKRREESCVESGWWWRDFREKVWNTFKPLEKGEEGEDSGKTCDVDKTKKKTRRHPKSEEGNEGISKSLRQERETDDRLHCSEKAIRGEGN